MENEDELGNFIVCYMERVGGIMTDGYEVFLDCTYPQVEEKYNEIIQKENIYSVNLCRIIKSTDY